MKPRARKPLLALIGLCSLYGCAGGYEPLPPAPVIAGAARCPAPEAPLLPGFDGALPFDSPQNVETLLLRDDLTREHINGLKAALRCYEAQTGDHY